MAAHDPSMPLHDLSMPLGGMEPWDSPVHARDLEAPVHAGRSDLSFQLRLPHKRA